ncbi:hypothetical protein BDF19DRAFT_456667 [Syncephalis fuscata]|nr:hypothetical protein BDF19DRAFT_456667 [Syncephalis fuscata]
MSEPHDATPEEDLSVSPLSTNIVHDEITSTTDQQDSLQEEKEESTTTTTAEMTTDTLEDAPTLLEKGSMFTDKQTTNEDIHISTDVASTSPVETEPSTDTLLNSEHSSPPAKVAPSVSGNLQVPPVNRLRRSDPDHFQFEMVEEEFNWASGTQTPSDLGEALTERNTPSTTSPSKAALMPDRIDMLNRVQSLDSESNWSESETASLIDEDVSEEMEEEETDHMVDMPDIAIPTPTTDMDDHIDTIDDNNTDESNSEPIANVLTESTTSIVTDTTASPPSSVTSIVDVSNSPIQSTSTAVEQNPFTDSKDESAASLLLKTPKAPTRPNQQLGFVDTEVTPQLFKRTPLDKIPIRLISDESPPVESLERESPPSFFMYSDEPPLSHGRALKFTSSSRPHSKAASTADEADQTAIHMGDEHDKSSLGDLSSILPEPGPLIGHDISIDGEMEIEEEVDEAVVAAAKIATVVAASPNRRRREVETPELYASVALVVQQQHEEARRTRLSISEPKAHIEAQFINRLQESISAAAIASLSPNSSNSLPLFSSENDFDTVTSLVDARDRMTNSMPAFSGAQRSLSSSMLRANSDEDKLTALLLQPSSLESLRKIVPAPETNLTHLSIVLAGDAPDEVSRQQVLRAFARALHSSKGGSKTGHLNDYANVAQYGLNVADVTGTVARTQQQMAFQHSELCIYFLRPPVSKTQLDGAAECARQISILPVCLSQGDRLFADQRLITRGLTQRKVANTVLTPGTTSTRQKIRFVVSVVTVFLVSLFLLVILPGDGSTGRDALDAALPPGWSRWLAQWSPFTGTSTSQSSYSQYYDTVYHHKDTRDDDPHADWIYVGDDTIVENVPEYEALPQEPAKKEKNNNKSEDEEMPDDLFSWFGNLTRQLSRYLKKKEELSKKPGIMTSGIHTIVQWIDALFGTEDDDDTEQQEDEKIKSEEQVEQERRQRRQHRRRIRIRRTRHRTYDPGMRGNLHWVMDVGLDGLDDARIWLYRTTEPLRRELVKQTRLFLQTEAGKRLQELRQLLRDQLADLIKRM